MFSQHEPSDEILRTLVSEERFNETSVKDIVNSFGTGAFVQPFRYSKFKFYRYLIGYPLAIEVDNSS